MNPIENIVIWRLSKLETELGITLDQDKSVKFIQVWKSVQKQLFLGKYINVLNDYFTDVNRTIYCRGLRNSYIIICNIIWKNIIRYEVDDSYIYIYSYVTQ